LSQLDSVRRNRSKTGFDWQGSQMGVSETFVPWDQLSARASRKVRISAILWAAAFIGLLFVALVCGLGVGMNLSAFLCAPDRGVMDTPY
jgi:hypothetical protein